MAQRSPLRITPARAAHHVGPGPYPIDIPQQAADEIVPRFASMASGVVLLLLDDARIPLVGISIADAPRNEFEPIINLLAKLRDERLHSVILGVLSNDACIADEPFVFGDSRLETGARLAVEAATVHAWAEFSCRLDLLGLTLLDVIECTPSSWASVHAPRALYGGGPRTPRLGTRPPPSQTRHRRASAAS